MSARNVWQVARRDLLAYLHRPMGYVISAIVLAVDGLLFHVFALGAEGERLSTQVLEQFFYFSSGTTLIAALLLSMRLIAEERQAGTLVLLRTAPVSDAEIVLGKFLSAWLYLSVLTLLTLHMPLLILVNGKVALGHLAVGYLGLLLLGAAAVSIGLFASTLAANQVVAAVIGAGILVALLLLWLLAKAVDSPLSDVFAYLDLYAQHFNQLKSGLLRLRDVIYYGSLTYLFLLATTRVLAARRWS